MGLSVVGGLGVFSVTYDFLCFQIYILEDRRRRRDNYLMNGALTLCLLTGNGASHIDHS